MLVSHRRSNKMTTLICSTILVSNKHHPDWSPDKCSSFLVTSICRLQISHLYSTISYNSDGLNMIKGRSIWPVFFCYQYLWFIVCVLLVSHKHNLIGYSSHLRCLPTFIERSFKSKPQAFLNQVRNLYLQTFLFLWGVKVKKNWSNQTSPTSKL